MLPCLPDSFPLEIGSSSFWCLGQCMTVLSWGCHIACKRYKISCLFFCNSLSFLVHHSPLPVDGTMDMDRVKCIPAVSTDIKSFPLIHCTAFLRAISSALWADVPRGRASVHVTSSSVVTSAPAYLIPFLMKLLPTVKSC